MTKHSLAHPQISIKSHCNLNVYKHLAAAVHKIPYLIINGSTKLHERLARQLEVQPNASGNLHP